jgi:hypothetical protein
MNADEHEWGSGWGLEARGAGAFIVRVACGVGCRSVALKGQNVGARAEGPGNGRPKNIPKPCRGVIPVA